MLVLPMALGAQTAARSIDSSGLGAAIAARLVAEPPRDSSWVVVIDTSGNRWNAFVRRALVAVAPARVPTLTDSVAHFAQHFNVTTVEVVADTLLVTVNWSQCFGRDGFAFVTRYWTFGESSGRPRVLPGPDRIITGHGVCTPFKARRPR